MDLKIGGEHPCPEEPYIRSTCFTLEPPPSGFVKIKVDGAVVRNLNFGSFSVVCRDKYGLFPRASALKVVGISDPSV
jgi:hypothetical protein